MRHANPARGLTGGTPSRFTKFSAVNFSRNQIIGAIVLLAVVWLVIAIRLIIARG
jgi:hypothetical protein